jgi:hypothetical protein
LELESVTMLRASKNGAAQLLEAPSAAGQIDEGLILKALGELLKAVAHETKLERKDRPAASRCMVGSKNWRHPRCNQ